MFKDQLHFEYELYKRAENLSKEYNELTAKEPPIGTDAHLAWQQEMSKHINAIDEFKREIDHLEREITFVKKRLDWLGTWK